MSDDPNNNLLKYIVATVDAMREDMVRRTELQSLHEQVEYIGGQLETVRDQMATKSDIARIESRLEVQAAAIRGDIEQVNLRLDSI